ncbi:hypothetical protein PHYPO_G00027670 [Pangasianodon hypophthalmus]|uniref:Uncharacterized protein n=1 Tax=Pangasianodon hypophthalmus TaxID=310915 RepID=A0A5N5MWS8_PANHP|nr:hypothetical protein PHYPO_G00027670 [Pangasianodon hypophthalmus]
MSLPSAIKLQKEEEEEEEEEGEKDDECDDVSLKRGGATCGRVSSRSSGQQLVIVGRYYPHKYPERS